MKLILALSVLLLGSGVSSDETYSINSDFYVDDFIVYLGENDITKIVVPLNSINFDEDTDIENIDLYVFFIETGKGLYVLKNEVATHLLHDGKDISSSMDDSKKVFIGSSNGIYTFNAKKNTVDKYGTLTDNIRNIVVTNDTNEIYILTEDRILYKVTDKGTNKEPITNVKDAVQIVLDTSNNLYFIDGKKRVFVRGHKEGTIKRIKGLPAGKFLEFLRPPAVLDEQVPLIAGRKVYVIDANGESKFGDLVITDKPTAFSTEASFIIYLAHDKKIYKYNILDMIASVMDTMEPVKSYINKKAPNFRENIKRKALRQY